MAGNQRGGLETERDTDTGVYNESQYTCYTAGVFVRYGHHIDVHNRYSQPYYVCQFGLH